MISGLGSDAIIAGNDNYIYQLTMTFFWYKQKNFVEMFIFIQIQSWKEKHRQVPQFDRIAQYKQKAKKKNCIFT